MKPHMPIKIFIIEDNKAFSLLLKSDIETTFIDKSLKIQLFETGEACLQKIIKEKPHIIILDYHLNAKYLDAIDGIKVLDWIKEKNIETFVIMMTANDNIDVAIKSFKHGASDYIVKTETQFKKINFSLLNYFKILKATQDFKKYKKDMRKYLNNHEN